MVFHPLKALLLSLLFTAATSVSGMAPLLFASSGTSQCAKCAAAEFRSAAAAADFSFRGTPREPNSRCPTVSAAVTAASTTSTLRWGAVGPATQDQPPSGSAGGCCCCRCRVRSRSLLGDTGRCIPAGPLDHWSGRVPQATRPRSRGSRAGMLLPLQLLQLLLLLPDVSRGAAAAECAATGPTTETQ